MDEFTCAGDAGDLVGLTACQQAFIKRFDTRIGARRRQGRHIQGFAQGGMTAASDGAMAPATSARLPAIGHQARESRRLFGGVAVGKTVRGGQEPSGRYHADTGDRLQAPRGLGPGMLAG